MQIMNAYEMSIKCLEIHICWVSMFVVSILKSKNTNNKHGVCSCYGVMYNYLCSANVASVLLITKGKSLAIPNFSIIKFHQLLTIPSKGPQFLLQYFDLLYIFSWKKWVLVSYKNYIYLQKEFFKWWRFYIIETVTLSQKGWLRCRTFEEIVHRRRKKI